MNPKIKAGIIFGLVMTIIYIGFPLLTSPDYSANRIKSTIVTGLIAGIISGVLFVLLINLLVRRYTKRNKKSSEK
jgi:uncharacterized membrane protein (DUF485 family)